MSAEPIAEVVADIRAGRVEHPAQVGRHLASLLLKRAHVPQPVVDCTAVFTAQQAREEVRLYDDHPSITPPWEDAFLCYVNTFGNVIAMQVHRRDWDGSTPSREDWRTDNEVDWASVRWIAESAVWVGGRSHGKWLPATGPVHMFRHAIRGDGAPEDINWLALLTPAGRFAERQELGDSNQGVWDACMITLGAALNFLSCSNVDIAEPRRARPFRRRLERTGVTVQEIVVRAPGKRRAASSAPRPIAADETAFSPVRGHFSRYGPAYDRGLLFGKYEGKFWVPAHVRGQGEAAPRDYVLKPGAAA